MKIPFATLFVSSLLIANTALAAPLENYFFSFNSCYGRSYSFEHLQKNPDQKVIDMAISHFPGKQELLGLDSPFQPYPETPKLILRVDVWLRGQDTAWQESAFCEPAGDQLKCGFECDGGTFYLTERSGDRLLLSLKDDLSFTQCDAGNAILQMTAIDKDYLLSPMPRSHCRPD
ncbi:MAG: hypothetical protein JJ979_23945 [Roseibium sp.]|nr:hypothetical protein [Roseibium sp.]